VTVKNDFEALSDLELIAAINRGEAAAFDVLYFRYRDWVVSLAFRFTADADAALDVLQDTFLYVLKKFPGFKLTAGFKTFLYPAVRNLSIAARNKALRYQANPADTERLERVAAPAASRSVNDDLGFVVARLPEEQREVVLLRFVDGLSLGEVAEAMAIPLGTVKSRLHNALQSLRQDELTRKFFEP
jgi:RNA polymerase sigma-70 factor (ECF subfamily)